MLSLTAICCAVLLTVMGDLPFPFLDGDGRGVGAGEREEMGRGTGAGGWVREAAARV